MPGDDSFCCGDRPVSPSRTTALFLCRPLLRLGEPVIQRVAGAAHGADRILLAAGIEQLAQAADMHVDGALVDIDVAAPDRVEQMLAGKDAAGMLEEEFQKAIFG